MSDETCDKQRPSRKARADEEKLALSNGLPVDSGAAAHVA